MKRFSTFSRTGITLAVAAMLSVGSHNMLASDWAGANANWSDNGNPGWNGTGVPNGIGAVANHPSATSSTTIQDVGGGVTVGTISLTNNSNSSWTITNTNGITMNHDGAGAGTATISNTNTDPGTNNFLQIAGGTLTLADDLLISNTGNSGSTTGSIQITGVIQGTGNLTLSNTINALSQTGSLRISTGVNTFTGSILVQKGTTTFNNQAFGNTANVITLGQAGQGGVTLLSTAQSASTMIANNITVASGTGGTSIIGTISTANATTSGFSGNITLNGDLTVYSTSAGYVDLGSGTTSAGNKITGVGALTKAGTGNILLRVANDFSGGLNITDGIVKTNGSSSITGTTINNGPFGTGTLTLTSGNLQTVLTTARTYHNSVVLAGDFAFGTTSGNGFAKQTFSNAANGTTSLTGNRTLTFNADVDWLQPISGNFTLTKTGPAILTLANTSNSFTGLNITQGVLVASADHAVGLGNVSASGAGTILRIQTGVLDAISDSASLSLSSGAIADLLYTGADTVAALILDGNSQAPGTYNSTTSPTYFTGPGSITVIPEPSTWMILVIGAGTVAGYGFRRNRRTG
jgi:autotransporter-associated beta strand protein